MSPVLTEPKNTVREIDRISFLTYNYRNHNNWINWASFVLLNGPSRQNSIRYSPHLHLQPTVTRWDYTFHRQPASHPSIHGHDDFSSSLLSCARNPVLPLWDVPRSMYLWCLLEIHNFKVAATTFTSLCTTRQRPNQEVQQYSTTRRSSSLLCPIRTQTHVQFNYSYCVSRFAGGRTGVLILAGVIVVLVVSFNPKSGSNNRSSSPEKLLRGQ